MTAFYAGICRKLTSKGKYRRGCLTSGIAERSTSPSPKTARVFQFLRRHLRASMLVAKRFSSYEFVKILALMEKENSYLYEENTCKTDEAIVVVHGCHTQYIWFEIDSYVLPKVKQRNTIYRCGRA